MIASRHNARTVAALLLVLGLFLALRVALKTNQQEVSAAAVRFKFSRATLPELPGPPIRNQRLVHPSLERVSAFVSTVGAAVALNDLDDDGVSNDACYIDTRTDQVIVTPVPGTGNRYAPFALIQEPLFNRDTMAPLGVLLSDLNEDGYVDLIVYYAGRTPLLFLRRPSTDTTIGAASYVARDMFPKEIWMTGSATIADLDGDGHLDLIFANYFKDGSDLYNPNGSGTVSMPQSFSHAFNGGGERIYRWISATTGNDPNVSYEEVRDALPPGVGGGWGLAVGACDLDEDLLPELYVAHDFGPDRLFWNRSTRGHIRFVLLEGREQFNAPKSYVLGHDSFKGMGVDFADLNRDGIPDIYVSNITEPKGLQESQMVFLSTGDASEMQQGIAPYVNRAEALGLSRSGWAWDAKLDDFDNDGVMEALQATGFVRGGKNKWPELQELGTANDVVITNVATSWPRIEQGADIAGHNQNPFFVRVGGRFIGYDGYNGAHYVDISREIGFSEDYVSRGIAIGDVDADGSLDLIVSNMWGPASYYHNEHPATGTSLELRLLLPLNRHGAEETRVRDGKAALDIRGRAAVGAVVNVSGSNGWQTRFVDGGNGHSGKRSPELHFGLGNTGIETTVHVEIRWRDPDGHRLQEFLDLKPGRYTIVLAWANSGGPE
ncbi:MAG TPA: CRTAC1 family protein [Pyrinomonadaceae bacterium]|nr:CRTAC1 family protein [Pyrinomonadaceae bacterium]